MMFKFQFDMGKRLSLILLLVAMLRVGVSSAQDETSVTKAVGLIHKAMDAYGNLDFDACLSTLNEALSMSEDLDRRTLARIYEGYGVLWSGGYADNAKGTTNFLIAVCLDESLQINPLFSTPEVDLLFKLAREQATPERCADVLGAVTMPDEGESVGPAVAEQPTIEPCGEHDPLTSQKQKYELPFYVSVKPEMRSSISRVVVHYAFDGATTYKMMELPPRGSGYGALLNCDTGQIRIFDPATVNYYIEGQDATGNVICGHGTMDYPQEVMMLPDAAPLGSIAGLLGKECAPCPPWDDSCGKVALPGEGDSCSPEPGCAEGLTCGESGLCEPQDERSAGGVGPSKFYLNIMGGTGVGFLKKELTIKRVNDTKNPDDYTGTSTIGFIENHTQETSGTAWSGIPLRLAVGFFVTPKLSLEVTGRFDVYITSKVTPKSCWEVGGKDIAGMENTDCYDTADYALGGDPDEIERVGKTIPGNAEEETFQYAWLVNARVRYEVYRKSALALNIFGGLGYGHFQYRVKPKEVASTADESAVRQQDATPFFPMTGAFDVELGLSLAYFFNRNVGLVVEVPIDFVFSSGFSANADFVLGLGFGF